MKITQSYAIVNASDHESFHVACTDKPCRSQGTMKSAICTTLQSAD